MKNLIKTNSTQPSFNLKSIVKNISSYNKRKQEEKESHNLKSKHNRRKMKTNLNTKKLEEERRINDLQRMKDKLENKQDEWINDKYYFEKSK